MVYKTRNVDFVFVFITSEKSSPISFFDLTFKFLLTFAVFGLLKVLNSRLFALKVFEYCGRFYAFHCGLHVIIGTVISRVPS